MEYVELFKEEMTGLVKEARKNISSLMENSLDRDVIHSLNAVFHQMLGVSLQGGVDRIYELIKDEKILLESVLDDKKKLDKIMLMTMSKKLDECYTIIINLK